MEKVDTPKDNSFPKNLRILKSEAFSNIFSNGKKVRTKNFILYVLANDKGYPRLGLAVGKKVSNKAVRRNRIKRILRESFRTNKILFDSYDIILVVKNEISGIDQSMVINELKAALSKLNV